MINLLLALALATSTGVVAANLEPTNEAIAYEALETDSDSIVDYVLEYDCETKISRERAIVREYIDDGITTYTTESNLVSLPPNEDDFTIIEEEYSDLLINPYDESSNSINSRAILGGDTRVYVNLEENYRDYTPFCLIYSHFDTNSDGTIDYISRGSGVMAGPDLCLSAAHVVFNYDAQVWASQVVIYPVGHLDEFANFVAPYGGHNPDNMVIGAYYSSPTPSNDWAILRTSNTLGITVGWYASTYTEESLNNTQIYVIGYQDDQYRDIAFDHGYITQTYNYQFDHNCDTTQGTSGAPVLTYVGENICGIHTGYKTVNGTVTTNLACRMTEVIFDLLFETSNFW